MRKIAQEKQPFERRVVTRVEAMELAHKGRLAALSDRDQASKFKADILKHPRE